MITKIVVATIVTSLFSTSVFAQDTDIEKTYENLDSRSKRILADRAQHIYKLPEGDVVDISTGIDQYQLFKKSVVVEKETVNRNNGGFVQKEVVSSRKTLKDSDEVQAYQTLPIAVVFKNGSERTYDKNFLADLNVASYGNTAPNAFFVVEAGREYWRDVKIELTPSADPAIFVARVDSFIIPQEISNYPHSFGAACYIDSKFLQKGQLKTNKEYIVRVKYTDDPKNRVETRAVNGKEYPMYEILDAQSLRVSPEDLYNLIQQGEFKLYEWDYKKNKIKQGRNTYENFVWTNKIVELKYSQAKKSAK